MAQYTALFDACVLYPMGLRDLLMELALTDTFRARWTDEILDEWVDAIHERRPDIPKQNLSKQCALMNDHVRDALIENYQGLIPTLSLPDPKDRHVLAAAIRGRADAIVTFNLKDFPKTTLGQYGIEAQHPDEFLIHLYDLYPAHVVTALKRVRKRLKNPPYSVAEHMEALQRYGLVKFVATLQPDIQLLEF